VRLRVCGLHVVGASACSPEWIEYSVYDAQGTWLLHEELKRRLQAMEWTEDGKHMYDYYVKYWAPFGELLTDLERNGIKVDVAQQLPLAERRAEAERDRLELIFRTWAASYCPEAWFMNLSSGTQVHAGMRVCAGHGRVHVDVRARTRGDVGARARGCSFMWVAGGDAAVWRRAEHEDAAVLADTPRVQADARRRIHAVPRTPWDPTTTSHGTPPSTGIHAVARTPWDPTTTSHGTPPSTGIHAVPRTPWDPTTTSHGTPPSTGIYAVARTRRTRRAAVACAMIESPRLWALEPWRSGMLLLHVR
jgi:hypothetical protein